jgi:hypothetical protein
MNNDSVLPPFVLLDGELHVSNRGQLQLLQAVIARGAPFRTTVRGCSMLPFIRDKDVLTIAPLNDVAPHIGEVVAFIVPGCGMLAIHRIIARVGDDWIIRGDNCFQADGIVSSKHILGRVTRRERRGRVVHFGLGREARFIAWLQRAHLLIPALNVVRWIRKGTVRQPDCCSD